MGLEDLKTWDFRQRGGGGVGRVQPPANLLSFKKPIPNSAMLVGLGQENLPQFKDPLICQNACSWVKCRLHFLVVAFSISQSAS